MYATSIDVKRDLYYIACLVFSGGHIRNQFSYWGSYKVFRIFEYRYTFFFFSRPSVPSIFSEHNENNFLIFLSILREAFEAIS